MIDAPGMYLVIVVISARAFCLCTVCRGGRVEGAFYDTVCVCVCMYVVHNLGGFLHRLIHRHKHSACMLD